MPPIVNRTYGQNGTSISQTNIAKYKSRRKGLRRRPLEPIVETLNSTYDSNCRSKENVKSDPFDKLLLSPMKQPVTLKPLSHWAKKVAELDDVKGKSKVKGLYELSSSDESTSIIKKKARQKSRPRPRKKKENFNFLHNFKAIIPRKVKEKSSCLSNKNEGCLIKERLLYKKAEEELNRSLLTFSKKPPIFGLSSTPGHGKKLNLVQPSFFEFCSPISNSSRTPNLTTAKKTRKSLVLEDMCSSVCHTGARPPAKNPKKGISCGFTDGSLEYSSRSIHDGLIRDLDRPPASPDSSPPIDPGMIEANGVVIDNYSDQHSVENSFGRESSPFSGFSLCDLPSKLPCTAETALCSSDDTSHTKRLALMHSNVTLRKRHIRSNQNNALASLSQADGEALNNLVHPNVTIRKRRSQLNCSNGVIDASDVTLGLHLDKCPNENEVTTSTDQARYKRVHPNVTIRRRRCLSNDRSSEVSVRSSTQGGLFTDASVSPNDSLFLETLGHELTDLNPLNRLQQPKLVHPNITIRKHRRKSHKIAFNGQETPSKPLRCSAEKVATEFAGVINVSVNSSKDGSHQINEFNDIVQVPDERAKIFLEPKHIKRVSKDNHKGNNETPEVSEYFNACASKQICSSNVSSPSFVMSSSPESAETKSQLASDAEVPSKKQLIVPTSSEDEIESSPCMNKTHLRMSTAFLMGGKQHNRARAVLRQLQTGRLTLQNASLLPHAPPCRGRAYESFVEGLLEMQPGLEGTLQAEGIISSGEISRLSRRPRTRSVTAARSSLWDKSLKGNPASLRLNNTQMKTRITSLSKTLNKTVHWGEPVIEHSGNRKPLVMRESCLASKSRRDSYDLCNVSMRVVSIEDHEPTAFRSAYSIVDSSRGGDTPLATVTWTAKDVILSRCNQTEPLTFKDHFNELSLPNCKKIGEGVYGEVFMYDSPGGGKTVFKVIPIEGEILVNDEPQKQFSEILSEIVISMELSNLRDGHIHRCSGFAELRRVWCVVGEYPEHLQDLWNEYDVKKGSENDSPAMFFDDQLYIILELAHGGQDLEAFVFRNAVQAAAAFRQAAFSLAVAEKALEFEHRDFHWGNVLLCETADKVITFKMDGKDYTMPTEGVKVTIIDFTLSRMTFEGCSVFNDLSLDPTLFTSEGDYQFEVYRMMRDETQNNWETFRPRTNVFWLHYTLDKMLTMVRYSRPKSKPHSAAVKKLRQWLAEALDCPDSSQLAQKCVK